MKFSAPIIERLNRKLAFIHDEKVVRNTAEKMCDELLKSPTPGDILRFFSGAISAAKSARKRIAIDAMLASDKCGCCGLHGMVRAFRRVDKVEFLFRCPDCHAATVRDYDSSLPEWSEDLADRYILDRVDAVAREKYSEEAWRDVKLRPMEVREHENLQRAKIELRKNLQHRSAAARPKPPGPPLREQDEPVAVGDPGDELGGLPVGLGPAAPDGPGADEPPWPTEPG